MATAKVRQIACGILFNRSFSILDSWGKTVDSLLYEKNSCFSPEYFPQISEQYTTNRYLSNDEKGHRFELNSNNIIYTHTIQENFEEEYSEFVERINKHIIPNIVEKNDLVVRRIGIVYLCEMDTEAINSFTSQYFKDDVGTVMDFRFSKKEILPESLMFSEKNNYINKIYSIENLKNNNRGIAFDYQHFFIPPIVELKNCSSKIFEASKSAFMSEIYKEDYRDR